LQILLKFLIADADKAFKAAENLNLRIGKEGWIKNRDQGSGFSM